MSWQSRALSPEEVVSLIGSHQRVFVHGAAATPLPLLEALARRKDLEGVTLYHLHLEGPCEFAKPEHAGRVFAVKIGRAHV